MFVIVSKFFNFERAYSMIELKLINIFEDNWIVSLKIILLEITNKNQVVFQKKNQGEG